jgi:hypothetical protein
MATSTRYLESILPLGSPILLDDPEDTLAGRVPSDRIGQVAADVILFDFLHLHEARGLSRRHRLHEGAVAGQDAVPDLAQ